MKTKILAVTLLLLTMPLLGCIEGDPVDPAGSDITSVDPELPATAATLHRPGANVLADDPAAVLGEDVPLPVGIARLSPMESFEPTLGVTSDGAVFLSSFDPSLPTGWGLVARSTDQGQTWTDVTPKLAGDVTFPPQSNDPYVHVDQDTDRIFVSDLQALVCSTLSWSDDGGGSWTNNPIGCGHPFGVHDHQTVFTSTPRTMDTVGYPNLVYYCINRVADTACATSLDGGQTFGPLRAGVFSGADPNEGICGGLTAHGVSGPDGRVYLPRSYCGTPTVAVTEDDGLTWEAKVISDTVPAARHDVEVAVDDAGNVYALWMSDDDLPYLAVSTDHGDTWTTPAMVAPPNVERGVFPAISAGADGRIAFTLVGTNDTRTWDEMDNTTTWNGYITVMTDATSPDPVLVTSPVNAPSDPLARGACNDDNRCDGMGDFNDIVIDQDGRPWAAYVDVCHDACTVEDGNDEPRGMVGTLVQGPSLRGALTPLPILEGATAVATS